MSAFEKAVEHARQLALLESISATVEWDEHTQLPAKAAPYRAEQSTLLSGLIHQRATDPAYGDLLREAYEEIKGDDPHSDNAATIRVLLRDFEKATKLPQQLVEAMKKNESEGQQAWIAAREQKDFSIQRPFLEQTIQLHREAADALGYDECPYDALLDKYEPEERSMEVRKILGALREQLVPLLQAIVESGREMPVEILSREYPITKQHQIGLAAAELIGFRFDEGRLDVTKHPFCTTLGPHDVRLNTRYDERFFSSAFYGTLHEAGHGIYEQGLRADWFGLPPGKHCSMAIHESQSRLYENLVARSLAFAEHFFPTLQAAFPAALGDADAMQFYRAVNQVKPSLIRVEADEVTYNLHIIIRFELEQQLINGELAVADLPDVWNEQYEKVLGVRPPHDGDGVMQDIHWSMGLIGYFPTYALGNLYAAQLFDQIETDLGSTDELFRNGNFAPLRDWLAKHVHQKGQCMPAKDLVKHVTGRELDESALIRRLKEKYEAIYEL